MVCWPDTSFYKIKLVISGGLLMRRVLFYVIACAVSACAGLNSTDFTLTDLNSAPNDMLAFNIQSNTHTPLKSFDLAHQTSQASLDAAFKKGIDLGILGAVTHGAGFIISLIAVPITVNKIRLRKMDRSRKFPTAGLVFSMLGMVGSFVGPVPSCIGGDVIEEAMEDRNIYFQKNPYWGYYARSWAYEGAAWAMYIIGMAAMKVPDDAEDEEKTGPILFTIGLYGLQIGAEIYRAVAAIGPVRYGDRAKKRIKNRQRLHVDVLPVLQLDGGAGVTCRLHF